MRDFPRNDRAGKWVVLASGTPNEDEALLIRSDAKVLAAKLSAGDKIDYKASPERHQYLVSASGSIRVNGKLAQARDGIAITGLDMITVEAEDDAEVVMVDAR